jgi:hypothetical protein
LLVNTSVAALAVPLTNMRVGYHGLVTDLRVENANLGSDAAYRARYVREFARELIHSWKPGEEGETNTAGILTGTTNPAGWSCPLGAASLRHEWRRDLGDPQGGRLGLTDTGATSMRRLDFPHETRPAFGAWLIDYEVRNPAAGGDEMIFALTPRPGVDPTLAGSQSYYVRCFRFSANWWRCDLHYENGAKFDSVDCAGADVPAGGKMKLLVTRTVAGDWQLYTYNHAVRAWFWSAAVGNHVTQLSSGCVVIAPRGAWVTGFKRFQGEMTPHELDQ